MKEDIAIIGGGIVGLTTAFYLAQADRFNIQVFDFDKGQATKVTGGVIVPWLSQRRNKAWYQLVQQAAAFYPSFIQDIGEDPEASKIYKKNGALIFKKKKATLKRTFEIGLNRRRAAAEMGQLKIMSPEDIRHILPIYDKDQEAIFVEGGARADGARLVSHLIRCLKERGVDLVHDHIDSIQHHNKRYQLIGQEDYEADQLILANGAWMGQLLKDLNYRADIQTQKGELAEVFLDHENSEQWPVILPAGGKNVIPMKKGRILVGATHEKGTGFSREIIPELIENMVTEVARQISDEFLSPKKTNYKVGIRGYTSDFSPFFGQVHGPHQKLFAANGFGATGLTAGPLVGLNLAQLIQGQKTSLNLADYTSNHYVQYKGK